MRTERHTNQFNDNDAERVRRHRGRGRGRGGPGWGPGMHGGPGFGAGEWGGGWDRAPWEWGGPRGRRGGPRVRRGDVRNAILDVLHAAGDDDLNGYQVIQAIAERSGGVWKPSPGSVYPTVSQLEDEGLVTVAREGGRKVLRLTPEGTTYVTEHADEVAAVWAPFHEDNADPGAADGRRLIAQTAAAMWQVMSAGTPEQQERATEVLSETRKKLYLILADEDDA